MLLCAGGGGAAPPCVVAVSRRRVAPVNAAACALRALALLVRPAYTAEVARVAGYTDRRMRTVLPALARQGLVIKVPANYSAWRLP